jgi:hypothetical protein
MILDWRTFSRSAEGKAGFIVGYLAESFFCRPVFYECCGVFFSLRAGRKKNQKNSCDYEGGGYFEIVLGGTEARCSTRCDGLQFL